MKSSEIISAIQISTGAAILLLSIVVSLKIQNDLSRDLSRKWLFTVSLMIFFFTGYVFSFFILLLKIRFPFELVTGSVFLGGACFVYIVVKLTKTSIHRLQREIVNRRNVEEKLRNLSLTDELTGLYNRRGFFTLSGQQLNIADRLKKRVSLISADLDNLKKINDTLGHQEGDIALLEAAHVLRKSFRETDIIARIGGDEFMILQMDKIDSSPEISIARLEQNITACNEKRGRRYTLSLSVGIARSDPESGDSLERLMVQADNLMYEQKRSKQR